MFQNKRLNLYNILIKEFRKEDLHLFLDTLNIRKMFRYIREEIRGK